MFLLHNICSYLLYFVPIYVPSYILYVPIYSLSYAKVDFDVLVLRARYIMLGYKGRLGSSGS